MRRICAFFLCLCLLPLPVRGTEVRYAALTFDGGPSGKYTRQLLDGLYDRGIHATFLVCGTRIEANPEVLRRIREEGHEIGIHGYSLNPMDTMSRRDIAAEIADTQALLPPDCRPVFFRPPGGVCSDGVRQVAEARGLAILSWSVDLRDRAAAADALSVAQTVTDGDILLLHDTNAGSVQAALRIADALLEADFQIVTVSELARLRSLRPRPGQVYTSFPARDETVK